MSSSNLLEKGKNHERVDEKTRKGRLEDLPQEKGERKTQVKLILEIGERVGWKREEEVDSN